MGNISQRNTWQCSIKGTTERNFLMRNHPREGSLKCIRSPLINLRKSVTLLKIVLPVFVLIYRKNGICEEFVVYLNGTVGYSNIFDLFAVGLYLLLDLLGKINCSIKLVILFIHFVNSSTIHYKFATIISVSRLLYIIICQ